MFSADVAGPRDRVRGSQNSCQAGWRLARRRVVAPSCPATSASTSCSPGIVGIAFALNMLQARGDLDIASTVFAIVVAGSLASDVLSLLASRREAPA